MVSIFEKKPELIKEWSDKNVDMDPEKISYGSSKKAVWKCQKGHEWEAMIKNRTKEKGSGCPYCNHVKVLKGFNDLASSYPHLKREWSDRNELSCDEVMAMSNRSVWWICDKGHEYKMDIPTRTRNGAGCPYCSGVLLVGFNDLASTHPQLAKEWSEHNEKKATEVKANCVENVRWKCFKCNHEWMMVVSTRVRGGECPQCKKKRQLIRAAESDRKRRAKRHFLQDKEKNILLYYLQKAGLEVKENDYEKIGVPLSIYLPEKNTAIELSKPEQETKIGKKREQIKDRLCKNAGVRMVRVLDPGYPPHDECLAIRKHDASIDSYEQAIALLFHIMGYEMRVDVKHDLENMYEALLSCY